MSSFLHLKDFLGEFLSFQLIPSELPVVIREYKNGMYSTFPYFLSKVISELPYMFGLPFLTMAVCYFMIGEHF